MDTRLSAALTAAVLLASTAVGQNLLTNGNFDAGGLTGWNAFGNSSAQTATPPQFVPRSDPYLVSMFGNFSGSFNVSGIFQAFPATPGDTFTIDCWSRHFSGDAMVGNGVPNDNWMVMKIAFFDGGNNEIAGVDGVILDGTSPTDTWIDNTPVTATAPAGTTSVQALILYLQPGNDGGAGHVDDVDFRLVPPSNPAYPGTDDDLALATAINGVAATGGPGNDVKTTTAGDLLEIRVSSPQGTYDYLNYYVLGQAFLTGSPPSPLVPGVWLDPGVPLWVLAGPLLQPFLGPIVPPGTGSSTYYVVPAGGAGFSVIFQAVSFSPASNNSLFAATDGHEIQIQ
jgi:hypothetical protein